VLGGVICFGEVVGRTFCLMIYEVVGCWVSRATMSFRITPGLISPLC
jgi:hypothetical protein